MEAPEQTDPTPVESPVETAAPETPQPITIEHAVKRELEKRGVKPKCLACNSIGWGMMNVGVVGWPTVQHIAQIALLICKKCAHLEPFDLQALGITLNAPEPSRVITPDQIQKKPLIVTG